MLTALSATLSAAPANCKAIEAAALGLTKDAVYQAPGEPEIIGAPALRAWATAYFGPTGTRWKKAPIGFTASADWAFERYHCESTDTARRTGAVSRDSGQGINVFHGGSDGRWRVAIDGWSSDRAPGS